jgi:zinc and cadmium transporter
MKSVWLASIGSVIFVSLLSLLGTILVIFQGELSENKLLYLVSFSVGGLFGGAFFHLLPRGIELNQDIIIVMGYLLTGLFTSFIVEMFLQWRHSHAPSSKEHPKSFAYMNLLGDGVHNFIDGVVLGGAYLESISLGFAATIAVSLHEIPQEIGDFGVLVYAGLDSKRALFYNLLSGLIAVLGTISALILNKYIGNITAFLLPFAAGNFIYISGTDLVPELHNDKNISTSLIQLLLMILGVVLLLFIKIINR